jgi:uncharacterized membrane protein YfhO
MVSKNSTARIVKYTHQQVVIHVNMQDKGFLVLADTWYPGWKAIVDNKPTKIYRANYIFRAIALPKGEHEVVFYYAPLSFKIGSWISIGFLVCIAIICIYGLWRRKVLSSTR